MRVKRFICLLLVFVLLFAAAAPVLAAAGQTQCLSVTAGEEAGSRFVTFFKTVWEKITAMWNRLKTVFAVRKEKVKSPRQSTCIVLLTWAFV